MHDSAPGAPSVAATQAAKEMSGITCELSFEDGLSAVSMQMMALFLVHLKDEADETAFRRFDRFTTQTRGAFERAWLDTGEDELFSGVAEIEQGDNHE